MKASTEWLSDYQKNRTAMIGETPTAYELRFISGTPTWKDRLRARWYVGFRYSIHAHCHTREEIGVFEEASLCYSALESMKHHPEEWAVDHYNARHAPSALSFWVANGRAILALDTPMKAKLHTRSQRRLWKAIQAINAARQFEYKLRADIIALGHSV